MNSGGRGAFFVGGLLAAFSLLGGLCAVFVGGRGAVFEGRLLFASAFGCGAVFLGGLCGAFFVGGLLAAFVLGGF